jgi:uncharacterized MAPEG superfamily protein
MEFLEGVSLLNWLGWAVVIGLAQILITAAAVTRQTGLNYNTSARDKPHPVTGMAARLQRAQANFLETFPFFAVGILALLITGYEDSNATLGAALYVIGRAIYVPLYAFGVPYLRTLVWAASFSGLVMVLSVLFT